MFAVMTKPGPGPAIATPDVSRLSMPLQKTRQIVWSSVCPILRFMAKALMEYNIRRATRELSRLDDRLLRDIGLSRWGLEDAVRSNRTTGFVHLGPEWAWISGCNADCDGCSKGNRSQR